MNNKVTVSLSTMIEGAKEELEILDTLHPNRFHCLKQDLHSLIFSLLHSHHPTSPPSAAETDAPTQVIPPSEKWELQCELLFCDAAQFSLTKHDGKMICIWFLDTVAVEAASTSMNKKRKKAAERWEGEENGLSRKKKKDKVDMVLERAQACLRKIHDFKTQLKET
ncbi:hypothetical protein Ancab_001068 [Ancistrocladus abbreviatus]